jgi:transcriptional regulator with XRE-family HTH domain
MTAGQLIREARRTAGLTQRSLALRTGTTQSAIARLENDQTNPTVETLEAMLHATGHRLSLAAEPREDAGVDESLIRDHLRAPREARLASVEPMYETGRELAAAGARARGELVD